MTWYSTEQQRLACEDLFAAAVELESQCGWVGIPIDSRYNKYLRTTASQFTNGFKSYSASDIWIQDSLRLNFHGRRYFPQVHKFTELTYRTSDITPDVLLYLFRKSNKPYFLAVKNTNTSIFLLDEELIIMLALYDNDIRQLVKNSKTS